MNSKRLSLITAAVIAGIGAFGASAAQANTYCANSSDPSCAANYTTMSTAVQQAVAAAAANPGPDTVLIGPGNFTSPTSMALYGSGTDNRVTIIGSGEATVLSVSDQDNPNITFDAGSGSSMSDLTFFIDASANPSPVKEGLVVRNSFDGESPTVSDVEIYSNPNPNNLFAVVLYDGADLDDSAVNVPSANYFTQAVKANGEGSVISDSILNSAFGASQNVTNGDLTLKRVNVRSTSKALTNSGGVMYVDDSLIELSSGAAQVAVEVTGSNTGHAETLFTGSTIIANAGSGIRIEAFQGSANADVFLDSSVLAGAAGTVTVNAANAGDATYFGSYSGAYDSSKLSTSGSGSIFVDPVDVVDLSVTAPGFVDAGAGNYRLSASSALIDAGQSADPPEGAIDLEGNQRACHGKADGIIRRDIGAFEFKTDPNDDCTYPVSSVDPTSGTFTDLTPTFTLSSSKAGTDFLCSIDDGPYAACISPYTTPTLTAGDHSLDVRAKDIYGNIEQNHSHAAFTVVAPTCATDPELCPPPTCETDPSLCPPPDKTAPKVIGLKSPKKTRAAKVTVRFKSNETGVTFTCKLNKAKAKKCKSPWKTPKLKKGKNTIAIQATDKAGNKSKIVKRVIKKLAKRR